MMLVEHGGHKKNSPKNNSYHTCGGQTIYSLQLRSVCFQNFLSSINDFFVLRHENENKKITEFGGQPVPVLPNTTHLPNRTSRRAFSCGILYSSSCRPCYRPQEGTNRELSLYNSVGLRATLMMSRATTQLFACVSRLPLKKKNCKT